MTLESALAEALKPALRELATEVAVQLIANATKLDDRIAYPRAEAARLLGVASHVLRDAEARGELVGSKVGSKTVYTHEELQAYLVRQRIAH